MSDQTKLTELQIASRIKAGKSFRVSSNVERKMVLLGAKYFGVVLKTSKSDDGKYDILFCKP